MPDVHSERLYGLCSLPEIGLSSGSQSRAVSLLSQIVMVRKMLQQGQFDECDNTAFQSPFPSIISGSGQLLYNFFIANRVNTFICIESFKKVLLENNFCFK